MENIVYTGFLLPVVGKKIYVAQRGTPPFQGYWGAIGGKSDSQTINLWNQPKMIEKLGGHLVVSRADEFNNEAGREYLQGTAVREFCEEAFSGRKFPDDFSESDFSDIIRLGSVDDRLIVKGRVVHTANYFYLAHVNRTDFSLGERELTGFKPLEELAHGDILFPLTKLALAHIHFALEFESPKLPESYAPIKSQIEPLLTEHFLTPHEVRPTDMWGAITYYRQCYFGGKPYTDSLVQEVLERIRKVPA